MAILGLVNILWMVVLGLRGWPLVVDKQRQPGFYIAVVRTSVYDSVDVFIRQRLIRHRGR